MQKGRENGVMSSLTFLCVGVAPTIPSHISNTLSLMFQNLSKRHQIYLFIWINTRHLRLQDALFQCKKEKITKGSKVCSSKRLMEFFFLPNVIITSLPDRALLASQPIAAFLIGESATPAGIAGNGGRSQAGFQWRAVPTTTCIGCTLDVWAIMSAKKIFSAFSADMESWWKSTWKTGTLGSDARELAGELATLQFQHEREQTLQV